LPAVLQTEAEATRISEIVDGGGCSAEILPSRKGANVRLTSATIRSADSASPRFDQSLSVMKACAVFCP
jgi:hypothetical protein